MKKTLHINNEAVDCYIEGEGGIHCLVVGAAGLFRHGALSKGLEDLFTFYFIDFWGNKNNTTDQTEDTNNSDMTSWEFLTDEIDQARKELKLPEVAVLGQSAGGGIALKYFQRYSKNCFFAIPIAFYQDQLPHVESKEEECECMTCESNYFIRDNADKHRQHAIQKLDEQYDIEMKDAIGMTESMFIKRFHADRPKYWKTYQFAGHQINDMWQDYHPNINRVLGYVTNTLPGYNFFKEHKKLSEERRIFWMQGLYDYSAPFYTLTDVLLAKETKDKYKHVDYHLVDSGHYPMFEGKAEFNKALRGYVTKHFSERLAAHESAKNSVLLRVKL